MKFAQALSYLERGHKIRRTAFSVAEYIEKPCQDSRTAYIKNRNEDSPVPTEKLSFNAIFADDWEVLIDGTWVSSQIEVPTATTATSSCVSDAEEEMEAEASSVEDKIVGVIASVPNMFGNRGATTEVVIDTINVYINQ